MGKSRVAPAAPAAIPLNDITIRWEQVNYFKTDRAVYEIAGQDLARVLSYIGRVSPSGTYFLSPDDLSIQAELIGALGELCHAMEEEDLDEVDTGRVLWALRKILDDMAARLAVIGEGRRGWPIPGPDAQARDGDGGPGAKDGGGVMGADVIPIRPGLVIHDEPVVVEPPPREACQVCGYVEGLHDAWWCNRCKRPLHEACFWGRVATLAEWTDYLERWIKPADCPDHCPPVECPSCRAKSAA